MKAALLALPPLLAGAALLAQGPAPETPRAQTGAMGAPDARLSRTGEWTVDPMHSSIGFEIEHAGISKVRGRFDKFSGEITDDQSDLTKAKVTFTAQADSIDTNVPPRDDHLRSKEFFDVARYPEFKFESTRIERRRSGYEAFGDLTMHGVTRPVKVPFEMYGPVRDGMGAIRRGIVAKPFTIDRRDFGISWQQTIPTGKLLSDTVEVTFSLEAVPKAAQ